MLSHICLFSLLKFLKMNLTLKNVTICHFVLLGTFSLPSTVKSEQDPSEDALFEEILCFYLKKRLRKNNSVTIWIVRLFLFASYSRKTLSYWWHTVTKAFISSFSFWHMQIQTSDVFSIIAIRRVLSVNHMGGDG